MAHRSGRRDQRPTRRRHGALRGESGKTADLADALDRYGDAIERDLAFRTCYRLSDFVTGRETPNTLANLVSALSDMSTSWLAQARATDLELYEVTKDQPHGRRSDPLLVEETLVVTLLKGIHELLQQNTHYSAAAAPKGTKRPKVKRLPRPKTAAQLWARKQAREAHEHVESVLVFVPDDQWNRTVNGGG